MYSDDVNPSDKLLKASNALGIGKIKRHIFLCLGPDCCSLDEGEISWKYLKKRIKKLDLDDVDTGVFRTKVGCLRVCSDGPIMLVYPEGIWYHHMTPERIEVVLQEHVIGGNPVMEYAFSRNPL